MEFFKNFTTSKKPSPLKRDTRRMIPLLNRFNKLSEMRKKEIKEYREGTNLVLTKKNIKILGTTDIDGEYPRLIMLVQLKTPYIDLLGIERDWIPFYQSSGQYSGPDNKGGIFPFYGMIGRRSIDIDREAPKIIKALKNIGITINERFEENIKRQSWLIKCNFEKLQSVSTDYAETFHKLLTPYYSNESYNSLDMDYNYDPPEDLSWENLIFYGAMDSMFDEGENSSNLFANHGKNTELVDDEINYTNRESLETKKMKLCNPYFSLYKKGLSDFFENNKEYVLEEKRKKGEIWESFYEDETKNVNDLIGSNTIFGFNLNESINREEVKRGINNIIEQFTSTRIIENYKLLGIKKKKHIDSIINIKIKCDAALPLFKDVVDYIVKARQGSYLIKGNGKKKKTRKTNRKANKKTNRKKKKTRKINRKANKKTNRKKKKTRKTKRKK